MDLGSLLRLTASRWWLLLLAATLAAAVGWLGVHNAQRTYEHEIKFVLRPQADLPPPELADVTSTLAARESPLVQTMVSVVQSDTVRRRANLSSGIGAAGADIEYKSALQPGSNVIVLTLEGHDQARLNRLAAALPAVASDVVASSYQLLRLDLVDSVPSEGAVSPRVGSTVALGALLGLLLAMTAVVVEGIVRHRRRSTWQLAVPELFVEVYDHARADQVEKLLRRQLRQGETLVRVGDNRLALIRVAAGANASRTPEP
jgi:capsular polysaccharide biosynthesis protein